MASVHNGVQSCLRTSSTRFTAKFSGVPCRAWRTWEQDDDSGHNSGARISQRRCFSGSRSRRLSHGCHRFPGRRSPPVSSAFADCRDVARLKRIGRPPHEAKRPLHNRRV
jgi:hypothetical protein